MFLVNQSRNSVDLWCGCLAAISSFGRRSRFISCRNLSCMKPPRSSGSLSRRRKSECFALGAALRRARELQCNLWLHRSQQSLFPNPPMGTWKPFGQEVFFQRRPNDEATVFSRLVSDPSSTPSVAHVRGDSLCPLADPLGLLLRH